MSRHLRIATAGLTVVVPGRDRPQRRPDAADEWINLDVIWAATLIVSGAVTLMH